MVAGKNQRERGTVPIELCGENLNMERKPYKTSQSYCIFNYPYTSITIPI